jgi:hypothetical protein
MARVNCNLNMHREDYNYLEAWVRVMLYTATYIIVLKG